MELLIKDFRISLSSLHSSIIELYRSIESSKGIYSIYIYTLPFTIHIITNDFIILNGINSFRRYINIGDSIAVLGIKVRLVYMIFDPTTFMSYNKVLTV